MSAPTITPGTGYVVPDRSLEQRTAALAKANRVRIARAELKREIADGEREALDTLMLDAFPSGIAGMPIAELLLAMPGLGTVKVSALLRRHRVSPRRSLATLSTRQRLELAAAVMDWRRNLEATRRRPSYRAARRGQA